MHTICNILEVNVNKVVHLQISIMTNLNIDLFVFESICQIISAPTRGYIRYGNQGQGMRVKDLGRDGIL
jgi:hypothetical protein